MEQPPASKRARQVSEAEAGLETLANTAASDAAAVATYSRHLAASQQQQQQQQQLQQQQQQHQHGQPSFRISNTATPLSALPRPAAAGFAAPAEVTGEKLSTAHHPAIAHYSAQQPTIPAPYLDDGAGAWFDQSPVRSRTTSSRRGIQPQRTSTVLYGDDDTDGLSAAETRSHSSHHSLSLYSPNRFAQPFMPTQPGMMSPRSDRSLGSSLRSHGMSLALQAAAAGQHQHQHQHQHQQQLQQQQQQQQQQLILMMQPSQAANMYMMSPQLQSSVAMPAPVALPNGVNPHVLPSTNAIDDAELMSAIPKKQRHRTVKVDDDTVAWLKGNFEMKPGCHVARNLVYKAYVAHMQSMMQEPSNAAGFGKTIRTVFKSVTSRRLGSRGNSRYHYDGLRIKPSSAVAMMKLVDDDEFDEDSPSTSPHAETRAQKSPTSTLLSGVAASSGLPHAAANATTIVSGSSAPAKSSASTTSAESLSALSNLIDKELQLPAFPPLTQADISQPAAGEAPQQQLLPIADEVLHGFSQAYRRFAEDAIEMVRKLQFKRVYASVHTMWTQKETTECGQLLLEPGVLDKIQLWDTILYDTMLHVLVPEVLRPIGNTLNHAITSFADDLLSSVNALGESNVLQLPEPVVAVKKLASEIFVNIVNRRIALNNLAQAGAKMLQSASQTDQMRQDLNRINLRAVRYDGMWVTGCQEAFVEKLLADLKLFMDMPRGIGALSNWLDRVVNSVFEDALQKIQMDNEEEMAGLSPADAEMVVQERSLRIIHDTARDFLRNWSYYSSQIMRELTVKSAPSFGSFNVLRLLMDEYVHYLVQTRVTHPQKKIVHPPEVVVPRRVEGTEATSDRGLSDSGQSHASGLAAPHMLAMPLLSPAALRSSASLASEWSNPVTGSPQQPQHTQQLQQGTQGHNGGSNGQSADDDFISPAAAVAAATAAAAAAVAASE